MEKINLIRGNSYVTDKKLAEMKEKEADRLNNRYTDENRPHHFVYSFEPGVHDDSVRERF